MSAIAVDRAVAPVGSTTEVESAIDREHLLDRLAHFRIILPAFAQELASARREAAALRIENRGLTEELRRLREPLRSAPP